MDVLEQFTKELKRANLNIAELDGQPCAYCGQVPEIKKIIVLDVPIQIQTVDYQKGDKVTIVPEFMEAEVNLLKKSGRLIIDRSSRYDCDAGGKKERLETYHIDCYEKAKKELCENQG